MAEPARTAPTSGRRRPSRNRFLLYVSALLVFLFSATPLIWMLASSVQPLSRLLQTTTGPFDLRHFTVDGYRELIATYPVWSWLLNSALVAAAITVGCMFTDSLAAYALARMSWRGRQGVFVLLLTPLMIPLQVLLVPLYVMMRDFGWIDSYLAVIVPFLSSPTGIFLLRQHFLTLPRELDEAAATDGASPFRTLRSIILPNSLAALGTAAVIKFIWAWGEFAWPSLVLNSAEKQTLPVGLASFQSEFNPRWDLLMAGSTIAVIPLILAFIALQKYFVRGLTASALAGE